MSYKVQAWSWCADYCKKKGLNPNFPENWNKSLLEYRRQHNIYEEKDNIVFVDEFMHGELMSVAWVRSNEVWMDDGAKRCTDLTMIRHATNEEIKAGHRLDLEILHDHDIPPNTIVLER